MTRCFKNHNMILIFTNKRQSGAMERVWFLGSRQNNFQILLIRAVVRLLTCLHLQNEIMRPHRAIVRMKEVNTSYLAQYMALSSSY